MRPGYILLHRDSITLDTWKNPARALAWIDFLTLADYNSAIVTASYGFLASRWRISKGTAHFWIKHWITERQVERKAERSTERNSERFFIVNYAKYQNTTERLTERKAERSTERVTEPMKEVSSIKSKKLSKMYSASEDATKVSTRKLPKHITPLAVFSVAVGFKFDNVNQIHSHIKRYLKTSTLLADFDPKQILSAYFRAYDEKRKGGKTYDITLETVGKKVAQWKDWNPPEEYRHSFEAILTEFERDRDILFTADSPLIR